MGHIVNVQLVVVCSSELVFQISDPSAFNCMCLRKHGFVWHKIHASMMTNSIDLNISRRHNNYTSKMGGSVCACADAPAAPAGGQQVKPAVPHNVFVLQRQQEL